MLKAASVAWIDAVDPADEDGNRRSSNPVQALIYAEKLPEYAVLFMKNSHRFTEQEGVSQQIQNLRDQFKLHLQTLVLLGPTIKLPEELSSGDVQLFEAPYPDADQLKETVKRAYRSFGLDEPKKDVLEKASGQLLGTAQFAAEQVSMMSMGDKGIEIDSLIERRRQEIETHDGLTVYRGTEKFCDIGGLKFVKEEFLRVIRGKNPPRIILNIEEADKVFGGKDAHEVNKDAAKCMLTWMQDDEIPAALGIGGPGTGKSLIAKAMANEAGVLSVNFDMGGMQDKWVGTSQRNIREAIKVIKALSGGRVFIIGTCNRMGTITPELRRRFRIGMFFFDLPDAEEREFMWKYYVRKYELKDVRPEDSGWTGAEIWQCCEKAWRYGLTPAETAQSVVPIAVSAFEEIDALRHEANNRYLSASYAGLYQYQPLNRVVKEEKQKDGRKVLR